MLNEMHYSELESRLGYTFRNKTFLIQALTHPSVTNQPETRLIYERLEFLGDAVLQLAVTEALFGELPNASEGEMTQLRARTVSRKNLGEYGFNLGLQHLIILGKGEEKAGGRHKNSIMANTFESVFGAIILDSDYETAKAIALKTLASALEHASTNPKEINPKGELQSILQDIYPESPSYDTQEVNSPTSPERFASVVSWRGQDIGSGFGPNKRKAEVTAALSALENRSWVQQ